MNIALVSFEFSGHGGIGTYVRNAARMLVNRGHSVEVFTSQGEAQCDIEGALVHSVSGEDRSSFAQAVAAPFVERHMATSFDVVECPEYGAEGRDIHAALPSLPLVTRLHTPSFIIDEIWFEHFPKSSRLRFVAGALRRGKWPQRPWRAADCSNEKLITLASDLVVGPSEAILSTVGHRWGIPEDARMHVPNVFFPSDRLLSLDAGRSKKTVVYVGRLEVRKGVLDLARAVPEVCAKDPEVKFLFVGRSLPMPTPGQDTKAEMRRIIGSWQENVRFVDNVPYSEVPNWFSAADVAVFPSIWENFPYVVLEAMAAGCAVIASTAGGISEIVDERRTGLLVKPRNSKAIATLILELTSKPVQREAIARAGREKVIKCYSPSAIAPLHERAYELAITRARLSTQRDST